MQRSGFILGIGAPAALLTVLAQPVVRDTADQWSPIVPVAAATAPAPLPGMRPVSLAVSPTRVAGIAREASRSGPVAVQIQEPTGPMPVKPMRRNLREGCEAPLSSLVGPEARRMVPGRCIS
ncbi:hypothetical protein QO016_003425 [Methylobacterium persicinum]|uniref:Uncharacterized protein n=1 Tax=Methylobacterium persicinum TaxID=374426 RepID=A0ABU0HNL9_9HYPH|nr:hypothetical protein [Methylobacterium persicinum]GJE37609.1 hypothetical protein KHHGKMAE_1669 [Methylobacterium persicinum]